MRGDQNIARRRLQERKALLKVRQRTRIHATAGELESVGGDRCEAICVHHGPAHSAFTRAPGPACTTGRMPGRQVCRYNDIPYCEAFSIAKFMHVLDPIDWGNYSILRIAFAYAAPPHHCRAPLTCHDAGAAQPLQFRNTACVVEMHMRIDDNSHVLDAKP